VERKSRGFGFIAKSAVAGLLGLLLLWSSARAVSSAHCQAHHADRSPVDHCVLCLFAHSQVIAAETSPLPARPISGFIDLTLRPAPVILTSGDYRLSPSRAPPFCFSPIVVG
jgi:hypothetical protein